MTMTLNSHADIIFGICILIALAISHALTLRTILRVQRQILNRLTRDMPADDGGI